jgi:hypothetical protein
MWLAGKPGKFTIYKGYYGNIMGISSNKWVFNGKIN